MLIVAYFSLYITDSHDFNHYTHVKVYAEFDEHVAENAVNRFLNLVSTTG